MNRFLTIAAGALVLAAGAGPASGAGLVDLIREAEDGRVRFTYEARPGVWGNGENRIITDSWRGGGDWCRDCEPGPVRVELIMDRGRVADLEGWVGGRWRGAADVDLGEVPSPEAASYLLSLIRTTPGRIGEEALGLAVLADGVTLWEELEEIALDPSVDDEVRESAVFWIGQYPGRESLDAVLRVLEAAGDEEIREKAVFSLSQHEAADKVALLEDVAMDRSFPAGVREQAIFWLGQVDGDEAVDALNRVYAECRDPGLKEKVVFSYSQRDESRALDRLMDIALHDPDDHVREQAVFWLGQSDDPRAIALIERLILN